MNLTSNLPANKWKILEFIYIILPFLLSLVIYGLTYQYVFATHQFSEGNAQLVYAYDRYGNWIFVANILTGFSITFITFFVVYILPRINVSFKFFSYLGLIIPVLFIPGMFLDALNDVIAVTTGVGGVIPLQTIQMFEWW